MAHVEPVQGLTVAGQELPFLYDVTLSVGAACAENMPQDVLLVQYMLKKIWSAAGEADFPAAPAPGSLAANGRSDATTRRWIREFQNVMHENGHPVRTDGVVDSWQGTGETRRDLAGNTIGWLNFAFFKAAPDIYLGDAFDPELPEGLRKLFASARAQAA